MYAWMSSFREKLVVEYRITPFDPEEVGDGNVMLTPSGECQRYR
jgi:hypothetical protein